jgi:hypothetical protein
VKINVAARENEWFIFGELRGGDRGIQRFICPEFKHLGNSERVRGILRQIWGILIFTLGQIQI